MQKVHPELSCGMIDRQDSVHILIDKGFSKHGSNESTFSDHSNFFKWRTPDCHWELALVWMTGLINIDHTTAARSTCATTKYMFHNEISKNHSYM